MFVSNPPKALKPKPKVTPQQEPQKVFEETEPTPERRPAGTEKTPERTVGETCLPEEKGPETPEDERTPEEVKPDLGSKKQAARICVDKTYVKIPEAKPKAEESLREGKARQTSPLYFCLYFQIISMYLVRMTSPSEEHPSWMKRGLNYTSIVCLIVL